MPARNRSAKAWEAASLSPNETRSLTDFSDIAHASRYVHVVCFCASPWRDGNDCAGVDPCPAPSEQSFAYSCSAATRSREEERIAKSDQWRAKMGQGDEKRAAGDGGSKF